jgi:hypothetical protein
MYSFTFSLLFCFALYESNRKEKINYKPILIILAIWFIFHDGFRWGIATDWMPYYTYFSDSLTKNENIFELGYTWLNILIRSFTENYSVFLIIHAIIVYAIIIPTILRHSLHPLLSLFLFYCLMLGYLGMNRQYIALAVFLYSFKYIFEHKFIRYLFCIFIALLFHRTAIIYFPVYFFFRKIPFTILIIFIFTACIISITNIMNMIPSELFNIFGKYLGQKMINYMNVATQNTLFFSVFGIIKRIFLFFVIIFFKKMIKKKDNLFYFYLNVYVFGAIAYILFNNTVFQTIVSRGLIYYFIIEIFLLPYLITIFKPGWSQRVTILFVAFYCMIIIEKGFSGYIKTAGYDIFRPYNSVIIDPNYEPKEKR